MQRKRMGLFLYVVLHVEESENGTGGTHGLLEAVVEVCELAHRVVQLEQHDDEGAKRADGHAAVLNLVPADEQQQRNGNGPDGIHERRTDGLDPHAAQVGAQQTAGSLLETQTFPKLRIERFHDAIAGHRFVEDVLDLGKLVLAAASTGADFPADFARRRNDHRDEQEERPTEIATQADDNNQSHDEREKLLQEFSDYRADRDLHAVHVVNQRGKDGAGSVLVEEARGAAQRGLVKMIAQVGDHAESCVVHQVGSEVVAQPLDEGRGDQ